MNTHKTVKEVFDNFNETQRTIAYEILGQALDEGKFDREALVMFNKEELVVMWYLINEALKGK